MMEFTVVEKHDTDLSMYLWDNDMREESDRVDTISAYAPVDLEDAFTAVIEEQLGCDFGWDEIDSDDLYEYVLSTEFKELLDKVSGATEKLTEMDDSTTVGELIAFLADFDPYDSPFDDEEGKINFYCDMVEMASNAPSELLAQLKEMREGIEDDCYDAEQIDEYIEWLENK